MNGMQRIPRTYGILLLFLAAALLASIVAAQELVTDADPELTPTVESSIAENEEVTDAPQQTDPPSLTETTSPTSSEDPVSFHGGHRLQTDGAAESVPSNSESSNSESESENVESVAAGPAMGSDAESIESKETEDPESQELFTLPAGK
ncbi:uncharacterized protein [Hyperolius riggenbachi]|uniref:uncharacterized protein isoform X2 n=1 Tax=Hyperolius riggenbachi TaxID=752182 RepID=UPI0035A26834